MQVFACIMSIIALVVLAALCIAWLCLKKWGKARGKGSAISGLLWLAVFVLGFVLYFIAFFQKGAGEEQSHFSFILSVIAKSFAQAICLFAFVFDYSVLSVVADGNGLYLAAVIACFVAGSLWTLAVMQRLFFKGITNGVGIWLQKWLPRRKKTVRYIVIGSGESAKIFLNNLTGEKGGVPKRLVTVITGEEKNADVEVRFKEFVGKSYRVISGRADDSALARAGVRADKNIRVIALNEADEDNVDIAERVTRIIFKYVFKNSPYCTRVDDPEFQRLVMEAIAYEPIKEERNPQEYARNRVSEQEKFDKYSAIKAHVLKAVSGVKLKARIKYSFIERTEHFAFAQNAFGKLDFFNPYEMRVREFFLNHPVADFVSEYIDEDKGRLKGTFNAAGKLVKEDGKEYIIRNIFVGFGASNYHMLRWSVMTGQLLGCDYNAEVFDENIKEDVPSAYQAAFKNQARGLFLKYGEKEDKAYLPGPNEVYNIKFRGGKESNVLSDSFYNAICSLVAEGDFTAIYIAIGDDGRAIETACEIRLALRERHIPLNKVRIFAKVKENTALNSDLVINNVRNIGARIETFGAVEEVYSRENVLSEAFEAYARAITNNRGLKWEFLSETERDSNRQVAIHIQTKLRLLGFKLAQKGEDTPVSEEEYKKVYGTDNAAVAKIISERDKLKYLVRESYINENFKGDNDPVLDTPRNNLARLEHLRWDAFQLVMGWTKKPIAKIGADRVDRLGTDDTGRKNEYSKQHACITTFEGLVTLRKLQAQKMFDLAPEDLKYKNLEQAEREADTVSYDFSTMDELYKRLPEEHIIVKA